KLMKEVQAARATKSATAKPTDTAKSGPAAMPTKTGDAVKAGPTTTPAKPGDTAKASPAATPTKPGDTAKTESTEAKTEEARRLLKHGREAYKAGDLAKAKICGEQARDKGADLKWWDDTPEKLLADVRRMETAKNPGPAKEDPRALLKQARDLYAAGKLDDAAVAAQKAKVASASMKWG